jgi:hypothetical protein
MDDFDEIAIDSVMGSAAAERLAAIREDCQRLLDEDEFWSLAATALKSRGGEGPTRRD